MKSQAEKLEFERLRQLTITTIKNVLDVVKDHPAFACAQPGQKVVSFPVLVDAARPGAQAYIQDVLLINRMDNDRNIVQELALLSNTSDNHHRLRVVDNRLHTVNNDGTLTDWPDETEKMIVFTLVEKDKSNFLQAMVDTIRSTSLKSIAKPLDTPLRERALPTISTHQGRGPGLEALQEHLVRERLRVQQQEREREVIVMRDMMIRRLKDIFEKVKKHPDFICDLPGRQSLMVDVPVHNTTQKVRLINRMNENLEFVQELEFGNDRQRKLRVQIHNDRLVEDTEEHLKIGSDNLERLFIVGFVEKNNTAFFDALENAVETPYVKTEFDLAT